MFYSFYSVLLCLPIVSSLVYGMCVYFAYNKVTTYNWRRGQPSDYGNTREDTYFQLNRRVVDVVLLTSSFLFRCQRHR